MKLKVDNIRHIHDHGLAVQFADPKLAALVAAILAKSEGKQTLSAGQSKLTVTKLGNVAHTEAFWSVGAYHVETMHYFDPANGLKYSIKRETNSDAHDTLKAVIFGGALPDVWRSGTGAGQDVLRTWVRSYAWTLNGAAGMRAKALEQWTASADSAVSSAENQLAYNTRQLEKLREQTPESFRERHARLRDNVTAQLADNDERQAQCAPGDLATLTEGDLKTRANRFGAYNFYDHAAGANKFGWRETPATVNPPVVLPNYSATISPDGKITLSSGIVCEFDYPQVIAWLKGETPAPRTRYGELRRLEVATSDHKPAVFLQCGCHRIDAASINAELAALLVPTHEVPVVPATPAVFLEDGRPQFEVRLAEEIAQKSAELTATRAGILARYQSDKADLTAEEANLPARINAQGDKVAADSAALAAAELARKNLMKPLGATIEDTSANIFRALNALLGKGIA